MIGTTTEGHTLAQTLTIEETGNSGMTIRSGTNSYGSIYFSNSTSGDGEYSGQVFYHHQTDMLNLVANTSRYMRWDSEGRLLLNTTSPGATGAHVLTIDNATGSDAGITIRSSTTGAGNIFFSDDTTGTAEYDGFVNYRHSQQALRFGTAAEERMRIDSSGNVGIGSDNPSANLHVFSGTDSNPMIEIESTVANSSPEVRFTNDNATYDVGIDGASDSLRIYDAGNVSERLRITSNGLIGINENNPGHYIDMNIPTTNVGIKMTSADAGSYMQFADNNTTGETRLGAIANDLKFDVNDSERLRIDSSGRMGLGTSSPNQKLHVEGSGSQYVAVISTDSDNTGVLFGDSSDIDSGFVLYANSDNSMRIGVNGGQEANANRRLGKCRHWNDIA